MNGENFRDGRPHVEAVRALERIMLERMLDPNLRVILVDDTGEPISDEAKRELDILLGRAPEEGLGDDAPGI